MSDPEADSAQSDASDSKEDVDVYNDDVQEGMVMELVADQMRRGYFDE